MVSACNEVVLFTNINTGDIDFKLYDTEALNGQVRQLKVSKNLLAVGFNDGTIKIYNLILEEYEIKEVH